MTNSVSSHDELIAQLARWMHLDSSGTGSGGDNSAHTVVFTGAGISTESGIPDFRSPGGVWSRRQPVMYHDFLTLPEAQYEYWSQKAEAHRDFADSQPNAGHRVLADWEQQGLLHGVITQNIDGLHQLAGNRQVLELHGTARRVKCLQCPAIYDAGEQVARFIETDRVPLCLECGGVMKHATISFGQPLSPEVLQTAIQWAKDCRLLLAIGSSLVVYPAAELPVIAQRRGARLAIINREPTPLDHLAEVVIHGEIGATLQAIAARLAGE